MGKMNKFTGATFAVGALMSLPLRVIFSVISQLFNAHVWTWLDMGGQSIFRAVLNG